MLILHTADWHLGDIIGKRRVSRKEDLERAVERVVEIARRERAETLLIAGDLFSDKANRQDDLAPIVQHLGATLRPFLNDGGTVLAVTGNHDKEAACQLLQHTMVLADPTDFPAGACLKPGRFYLATGPNLYRLAGRDGEEVQFLMMPYPTPARYLDDRPLGTRDETNRQLMTAFRNRMELIQAAGFFRQDLPTVLVAHIHVQGAAIRGMYRGINEAEDVVLSDVPTHFAYVALGHVHNPQALGGNDHVRYAGSIECLDFGEREDQKSVCLIDVAKGRKEPVRVVPLESTPMYHLEITDPAAQAPLLADQYPDRERALVKYKLHWKAGVDHRDELLKQIEGLFPKAVSYTHLTLPTNREV